MNWYRIRPFQPAPTYECIIVTSIIVMSSVTVFPGLRSLPFHGLKLSVPPGKKRV